MIEVDNFERIEKLLDFDIKHIYLVYLVRRKKDGNTNAKGNNKNRTIKSYLFQSKKQWKEAQEEIRTMCQTFNCRAYISINRKSLLNVLLQLNENINERVRQLFNNNVTGMNGIIDSAAMSTGVDRRAERFWVVDVDSQNQDEIQAANDIINKCQCQYGTPVIASIPTAHGVHLITHPFDTLAYEEMYKDSAYEMPELKKEALTLLYAYLNE